MQSVDLLTTDLIKESLKIDLGKSAHLVSWNHKNCSEFGDNFFNEVKRIHVLYTMDGIENEITYIAKLNPCKINDLFNPYRERAMEKEVFFYKDLVPVLNAELENIGCSLLNVPKYIHSSLKAEREVIILEDLQPKGYITISKERDMDEIHSKVMAKEISKLHAASFALERTLKGRKLDDVYPLLVESWLVGDIKLSEAFDAIFKKGLNYSLKLAKTLNEFEELIPWFKNLKNKEMETLVKELNKTGNGRVICHGDYHRTNVLFRYDEMNVPQDVMIIDWQTVRVANLGSEISYLLYSSFFGSLRSQFFPVITKSYYETMKPYLGSKDLTLDSIEKEVTNNHFGFLICFYLLPLSLCVSQPSELFKIEKNDITITEEEEMKSSRELLKTNKKLSFVLNDYLNHVSKTFV